MKKILSFLICFMTVNAMNATAATRSAADFMSSGAYSNLYPYMNNKMRVELNPGVTPDQVQDPVSTIARTSPDYTTGRRVVSRSSARSAVASTSGAPVYTTDARSASIPITNPTRRVVARGSQSTARASRLDSSYIYRTNVAADAAATTSTTQSLSSDRCLADYIQCMNGYCERDKTDYNRCYCSAKLAQIDSKYQPEIDSLVQQILQLQNSGTYTEEEMNQYWEEKVGQYTGDNSWINLDNALDINWADTESRVRGQQAFLTGHEYCSQHLQGCYYMADNMRDAYRSEIARDCATYENSLQKIKETAESVIENYSGD